MTRNKDRKRVIRSRMRKTGESYTAARARVLAHPPVPHATPPADTPADPPIDYEMLAGTRDAVLLEKTGRPWADWVRLLDADDAAAKPHSGIARLLSEKHGVAPWWAQSVTVGYERIKGLRDRGQRRGGGYEVGKSRTFAVPVRELFDTWAADATRRRWLAVTATVRTATAPKTVRLQWPDGTIVIAGFVPKGARKSVVAVVHTKLPDRPAADRAKAFWAEQLDRLAALLAESPARARSGGGGARSPA